MSYIYKDRTQNEKKNVYLYKCGTVLAQSPASCSATSSVRQAMALLLDEVGMPQESELSMTASSFTAATSFANSSDGDESGYEDVEYDGPTYDTNKEVSFNK